MLYHNFTLLEDTSNVLACSLPEWMPLNTSVSFDMEKERKCKLPTDWTQNDRSILNHCEEEEQDKKSESQTLSFPQNDKIVEEEGRYAI